MMQCNNSKQKHDNEGLFLFFFSQKEGGWVLISWIKIMEEKNEILMVLN